MTPRRAAQQSVNPTRGRRCWNDPRLAASLALAGQREIEIPRQAAKMQQFMGSMQYYLRKAGALALLADASTEAAQIVYVVEIKEKK